MNRFIITLLALSAVGVSHAGQYTFVPNPANLDNLDHYKYYSWGINWSKPQNENIVNAVLKIKNIYDWQVEEDHLYTHLLDSPAMGFTTFNDDQGGGDNWAGKGPLVGDWSDPFGGSARNFDLVYDFKSLNLVNSLSSFAADGKFGFGFDPDCHYFNDGASFTIYTETVPEPASMLAIGLGIAGLKRLRSKIKR